MNRLLRLLSAAVLILSLSLTGCMGKKEPEKQPEKKEQSGEKNGKKGDAKKKEDPIKAGATKMQSRVDDLRGALKDGGQEVTDEARKLDDAWESFEQKVEKKNPQLYNDVEDSLNRVLAGVQWMPFDNKMIEAELDKLDGKLEELKETKGEPAKAEKVDTKTGAAAMRHGLTELKSAVDAGDTALMEEKLTAVDKSWTQFEEKVKEESKEEYGKVEDSLHSLWAGVKARPLDTKKLKETIDKLDAQLAELAK